MPEHKGWERVSGHDDTWFKPVDDAVLAKMPKLKPHDPNAIIQFSNIFKPEVRQDFKTFFEYSQMSDFEKKEDLTSELNEKLKSELGVFFNAAQILAHFRIIYDYNEENQVRSASILTKELRNELGEFFGTAQALALLGYAHRRRS